MMTAIAQIKADMSILDIAKQLGLDCDIRHGKASTSCPFCKDTSRHLYLYPDSNRYHCFKCQASGDQIDLYCKTKNIPPKTAISELARPSQGQVSPGQRSPHHEADIEPKAKPDGKDYSQLYYEVTAPMEITTRGKEYLINRGISERLISKYDIKSIDDPNNFKSRLLSEFNLEELLESGLIDYSKNGKPYSTFFLPAIIFPHFDKLCTKVTTISSRNLSGDAKSFKLHGTGSSYYYGTGTKKAKRIFVFEGIINGLSYEIMSGEDNWIACCGLISPAKYEELKLESPNQQIILGLDPDEAGKQTLSRITSCTYINWNSFARQLGFRELQKHSSGKAWDMNEYLINNSSGDKNAKK